ncbi:lipid II:glycine glycyltransferase FemX [Mycoplasma sp. P36-A1]|uniref:lipid II:glycine glycyltransferase FemX n=1 Tax=Mycoplasma sp. P36-A1 TaxID=3252900 RepID=UPI003C2C3ED1
MEIIQEKNIEQFNQFSMNNKFGSILQTTYWSQVKEEDWKGHFLTFKENDKIVATAMLLERKAIGSLSLFYCSRGFVTDYNDERLVSEVITLLKKYVSENNGFALRFDPEIAMFKKDCRTLEVLEDNSKYYDMLIKHAVSKGLSTDMSSTFQPRFQMVVNLKDGQELISKIKSKKRRLVKETYLQARGYEIIEDTSEYGVKEFARLSKITEARQHVALRNEEYFMKMYHAFKDTNNIKIFFAKLDINKLISFAKEQKNNEQEITRLENFAKEHGQFIYTNAIICLYGTPMVQMFYGASDDEYSKYKAGYALHFHGIVDAQNNGYDYFNLGGVQGNLDDGLFRFKSEFHPELFEYVGDFDVVTKPFIYYLFNKALPAAKKIKARFKK